MNKSKLKIQNSKSIEAIEDLAIKFLEKELANPLKVENCILKTANCLEVAITLTKRSGEGLMIIHKNVKSEYLAEIYLHEINEFLIMKAILKANPKAFDYEAIEKIAHYSNCVSLNQYEFDRLDQNPIENYLDSDKLPDFESSEPKPRKQKRLEDFEDFKPIVNQLIQDIKNYHAQIEKQKSNKKISFQANLNIFVQNSNIIYNNRKQNQNQNLLIFGSERLEVKASSPESRKNQEKGVRD